MSNISKLQFNPVLPDFSGPTSYLCYRRNSVTANIRKKECLLNKHKDCSCFMWNTVKNGSVGARFNCILKEWVMLPRILGSINDVILMFSCYREFSIALKLILSYDDYCKK